MAHDLVIKKGLVVDGTGSEPFEADVAIDGDSISEVGTVSEGATRTIDAEGHYVTPGFVDLHTHFDAQAGWDPLLTPVSWHGVTTALFGNCGVTFAPCKEQDREFLAGMMETVEDIPKNAILTGLPWNWESYGEYLDSIESLNPAINITGLVGHCASRFYVMGERSITDNATDDEIEQIASLIGRSVKEGAVGFSTNRLPGHTLPDGRSIPGTFAEPKELVAISKAVAENGGILQSVLNYSKLNEELEILRSQMRESGARLLFSAPHTPDSNGGVSAYDSYIKDMQDEGLDITGLTLPRSGGFLSSLKSMIMFPGQHWDKLRRMTFEERLRAIRDPETRARLIEDIENSEHKRRLAETTRGWYWISDADRPNYVKDASESLASIAGRANEHPVETWLRFMDESDGRGFFHIRFFNNDLKALEPFLKADWILPGIGDAGAHVSQIMDSGWTSFMLSHWVRDKGSFSIQDAIRKLTSAQARVIGFNDRGTLAKGMKADVNVIDLDKVSERQPQLVHDFPDSAPRLIQRAKGYRATVCNGAVILEDNEHTGERAGRVLRNPNVAE
ncbi:MAG: amidohydrolase family protein [Gammaproteobacteria bacterium]|nr:amidohydrolase family protein [Gammaproteobacteria bacterium]